MINFSKNIYDGFTNEYLERIISKVENRYNTVKESDSANPFFNNVRKEDLKEILVGPIVDNPRFSFIDEYRKTIIFYNFNVDELALSEFKEAINELITQCETPRLKQGMKKYSNYEENMHEFKSLQEFAYQPIAKMQSVIDSIFQYTYINRKLRTQIMEYTGIFVCPYCNRNFISAYKLDDDTKGSSAQLDHFYPKNKFPMFTLSLYNFVPVCYHCNAILDVKSSF